MRQLSLDPVANELDRQRELRREVQTIAASLGWTSADIDDFCSELFGYTLLGCTGENLDWLKQRFEEITKWEGVIVNKHDQPVTKAEYLDRLYHILKDGVDHATITRRGDTLLINRRGKDIVAYVISCKDPRCNDPSCHGWKPQLAYPYEVKK